MAVPEEIRKVPRPKNTIVVAYGRNKDKYAVKSRIGCKSVNGRKIPIDGPTIGHIIDGAYVANLDLPGMKHSDCDYRRWADVQLCCNLSQDILKDLRQFYDEKEAMRTYAIAVLRSVEPDINDYELDETYQDTWLSVRYPGIGLSRNTVSEHISQLGRTCSRISKFMVMRAGRVNADHHVVVDGTLKSDESTVNTFSDFSRKALKKGTRDISVIYAYDVETGEPICSKAYPGNTIDIAALGDFISTNNVDKGIIVADKGFSYRAAKKSFDDRPDLHFLIPLKRDSKIIREFKMYEYNASVPGYDGLACRKERMFDGKFLYSFRDPYRAMEEERTWMAGKSDIDPRELSELRKEFGSIVFMSDVDMESAIAYKAYDERWAIEVMFMFYKDILKFDQTRVHEDWSVIGTEFINFLSVIMTYKMRKAFEKVPELSGVPYNHVLKKLRRASMMMDASGNWMIRKITDSDRNILINLGLLPRIIDVKNPRGRPKKEHSESKTKRPRGRPRKDSSSEGEV